MPFSSFRFHQVSAHRRLGSGGVGAGIAAFTMYEDTGGSGQTSRNGFSSDDGTGHFYSIRFRDLTNANGIEATVIDKMSITDLSVVQTWTIAPIYPTVAGTFGFKGYGIEYSQTSGYVYFGGSIVDTNSLFYSYLGAFDPTTGNMVWENYNPNQNQNNYPTEIFERNNELHIYDYNAAGPVYSTHDLYTGAFLGRELSVNNNCNCLGNDAYDATNNIQIISKHTNNVKGGGYNGLLVYDFNAATYLTIFVNSFTPATPNTTWNFSHSNPVHIGNNELILVYSFDLEDFDKAFIVKWNYITNVMTLLHTVTFDRDIFGDTPSGYKYQSQKRIVQTSNGFMCVMFLNGNSSSAANHWKRGFAYFEFDLTGTVYRSGLYTNHRQVGQVTHPQYHPVPKLFSNGQIVLATGFNTSGDLNGLLTLPADDSVSLMTEATGNYQIETGIVTSVSPWSATYTPVTTATSSNAQQNSGTNLWGTQGQAANGPNVVNTTAPFKFSWTLQPSSVNTTGYEAVPLT